MDIEQMIIRMEEMAAEIERLHTDRELMKQRSESPRITEQDFIAIIKSYMQVSIPFKVTFESWMSAEGRALLTKLNDNNNIPN